ncbi:MAG: hypothetical protein Fur0019_15750 [Tibeticola sp.]
MINMHIDADTPHNASDASTVDLGPLAWVHDELRKSLDAATKSLRRHLRDAEALTGADIGTLDLSQLRMARQQLHQAVGATEMVGLAAPARVLRAMESAVALFVQRPEKCTAQAVDAVERASFALVEYLELMLDGQPASAVGLFPQYRDVQLLSGAERIHPADLWEATWRWRTVGPGTAQAAGSVDTLPDRRVVDQAVLALMQRADRASAAQLAACCHAVGAATTDDHGASFWSLAEAVFEAVAQELVPIDLYVKRAASQVLVQYASWTKGDTRVSERLAKDLLFFCAIAAPRRSAQTPALNRVCAAYGLGTAESIDYEQRRYGRVDPALRIQARKRIEAAKEAWTGISGGNVAASRSLVDQFSLLSDSIVKLHPQSEGLAHVLREAAEATASSGKAPDAELALEVATSVLYLEAALADRNLDEPELSERSARLAERLRRVLAGGASEPLTPWMEDLYRRVSDRRTMGTVIGELRVTLGEAEKALDQYFRHPEDHSALSTVPGLLSQMRGVLSVLGLDQATQAVLHMRAGVEGLLHDGASQSPADLQSPFDSLANNLGALGFLLDMLNYQPALAKKLFTFDAERGELRPVMGRSEVDAGMVPSEPAEPPAVQPLVSPEPVAVASATPSIPPAFEPTLPPLDLPLELPEAMQHLRDEEAATLPGIDLELPPLQTPATEPPPAEPVAPVASTPASPLPPADSSDEADDLRGIFLEEAQEVIGNGLAAVEELQHSPADLEQLTTLRRAFHTLKGSSRMVGLSEFGEAAWSMEQVLNGWLAEHKPASTDLCELSKKALEAFGAWATAIAANTGQGWQASSFQRLAQAFTNEQQVLDLPLFGGESAHAAEPAVEAPPEKPAAPSVEEVIAPDLSLQLEVPAPEAEPPQKDEVPAVSGLDVVESPASADEFAWPQEPAPAQAPAEARAEPLTDVPVLPGIEALSVETPAVPAAAVELTTELAAAEEEEAYRTIGGLRIGIPLYNVYLNEADEWSRRLTTVLTEWSLEADRPVPADAGALAHSLAGSSATVGFTALSDLARTLEHTLHRLHDHPGGASAHAAVLQQAAEDIRRLLHQFAAGFLKEPDPQVLAALKSLEFAPSQEQAGEEGAVAEVISEPVVEPAPVTPEPSAVTARPVAVEMPPRVAPALEDRFADIAEETSEVNDVLDPDLFPIFEEEALELLPRLGGALRQWAARPDNTSARSEVLRTLHTLKGSARLAGALQLGEMAHRMESEIESMGSVTVVGEDVDQLLARLDLLEARFDSLRRAQDAALAEPASQATPMPELAAVAPLSAPAPLPTRAEAPSAPPVAAEPSQRARGDIALPAPLLTASVRAAANQMVRVRAQLLDRLVNQAGEVMMTRSRLEAELQQLRGSLNDLTGNLDRLRQQLRDIELQAESQMQSRLAQAKDTQQNFDPLEFDRFTRVQELTRMMAESVNDVATVQRAITRTVEATEDDLIAQARQTRALQQDLLRTRMTEFEGISERLYRVVRQAAKDTGKQVKLDIVGGSIEMDRGVLDRMTGAFEHILRNCVVHGIEVPAAREAVGKPATGSITIEVQQAGNDVAVTFADDGAGLDLERIRAKAVQQGLLRPDAPLSEAAAADLIFMPGFSTASEVTELAGRGVGMDVVRAELQAMGGRIETTTQTGQGTRFKLVLPLTTAVTQVVIMRTGALTIGVPANLVEIVRRVTPAELERAYRDGDLQFAGERLPFFWSGALLMASARSEEPPARSIPVVIFRSADQRVAVHVDDVLGNQEVVVKNLGPQLARLPGLAGMTLLASGAVVLIYNPVALATVYGEQAREFAAAALQAQASAGVGTTTPAPVVPEAPRVPLVLVVDDSITVRRVTQRLLQREGYRVALAADGLQALERLQEERPAIVLSDIEMPRMDGFDLARNIRADAALKDLPIVMITSRIAEKHREHAQALGVNHYLGKPYAEEELLSLIRRYTEVAVTA